MSAHIQEKKQQIPSHNHNLAKASTETVMTITVTLCFPPNAHAHIHKSVCLKLLRQAQPCVVSKEKQSQNPKIAVHAINMLNSLSCNL